MSIDGLVYRTGTVSVTNGSSTIVGVDTAWELFAVLGGRFQIAGYPSMPIADVVSETEAKLIADWPHPTLESVGYWIELTTAAHSSLTRFNTLQAEQLARGAIVRMRPDDSGSLAQRAAHNSKMKGFVYGINTNPPFYVFYEKASDEPGDWAGPFQWFGPAGADGDDGVSADLGGILGAASPSTGLDGGVLAIDLNNGANLFHQFTIAGNRTLGFPTGIPNAGICFDVLIKQDTIGGRELSFATGYVGSRGLLPTISQVPNAETLMVVKLLSTDRAAVFIAGQEFA